MLASNTRVLILGGDGYLGWVTAMAFSDKGYRVMAVDNYLKRGLAKETCSPPLVQTPLLEEKCRLFSKLKNRDIAREEIDCRDRPALEEVVKTFQPHAVIHFAEQPSAPYSMMGPEEAGLTMQNNLGTTFNLIWSVHRHAPECHIVKLGTMGEYGTPNIDIEEGWLRINHKGRADTFLFPRQGGSLYHTTKIMDTDLLWFYVRHYGIRVTDLMQGPVYGFLTPQTGLDDKLLPNFHYDDIFGTVLNRFMVQAVAGIPLTVYGKGGQTRGYINIKDTIQCIDLAMNTPPPLGEMRILNQFTEQFTIHQLAAKVIQASRLLGLEVDLQTIANPRNEMESHYFNPANTSFFKLGLKPHYLTANEITAMLKKLIPFGHLIDQERILPRVSWKQPKTTAAGISPNGRARQDETQSAS